MKNVHFFSILLLMLACFVPQAARAEYYGIKVAGVSVTSDNCNNITGSNIKAFLDGMRIDHPLRQSLRNEFPERFSLALQCQHHHHGHTNGKSSRRYLLELLYLHQR